MAGRMNRLLAVLISAVTVTSSVNFTAMGTKAAEGVNNVKDTVEADTRSGNSGAVLHSFEAPLVGNSGNILWISKEHGYSVVIFICGQRLCDKCQGSGKPWNLLGIRCVCCNGILRIIPRICVIPG